MSENFDWQTEEEGEWEAAGRAGARYGRRRRWILPLAILLAVVAAGAAISWQVKKRIAAAETAIRDEVISSFYLIRQANDDDDIELFRNLLSGADLEWAADQQALFAENWLFDLSPFGLAREAEAVADIQVTFAPELNSAEVSALVTYKALAGDATAAPITLQQTSVFRRGARWVWSPPKEEFWAGESAVEEQYLTVIYPTRDEALVLRLARDLNQMVEELCGAVGPLACPGDLTLRLTFSPAPGVLMDSSEQFAGQGIFGSLASGRRGGSGDLAISLPTPSLIGLPLDEAGYKALLNGYGTHVAMALVGRTVGDECCGGEPGFRAAARWALAEIGLDPWFGIEVDAGEETNTDMVQAQVALMCSQGFERPQRLFLLDLAQMTWQQQAFGPELTAIRAMPRGEGLLLLGRQPGDDGIRSQVWHLAAQGADLLFEVPVSPAEAELVSWELHERQGLLVIEIPDPYQGFSRYITIDLSACGDGRCAGPTQSTVNRPVWSPDGSQMLVRAYGLLWWRIGTNMVPIADGSAPFWLTEDAYGYARTFGQEQAIVVVEPGAEQSERVVLTTSDLRAALGSTPTPGQLLIARVIVGQPAISANRDGGVWYILAFEVERDGSFSQARLFQFDLQEVAVDELPYAGRLLSYNLAPGGGKIAVGSFVEESGRWEIKVAGPEMADEATLALEAGGSAAAVPSYSWSPDESWLLVLEQGVLTLFQPESGAIYKTRPPLASCVQAAWYGSGSAP